MRRLRRWRSGPVGPPLIARWSPGARQRGGRATSLVRVIRYGGVVTPPEPRVSDQAFSPAVFALAALAAFRNALLGVQLAGGVADDVVRMPLARRGRDAVRGADRRSGMAVCVFVGGAGVLAALVGRAFGQRSARGPASRFDRRFGSDFDDVAIGMMTLTPQLRVVWVNAALCALLGRDAEDLVGRSILEFTHPDDVQLSIQWSQSRLHGNVEAPLAKRCVRPDGSIVDVAVISALVEPEGAEPYFFSQVLDVTEQRRAERQKAVIADLGRRALECADVIALMSEAMLMVRETLGTATCVDYPSLGQRRDANRGRRRQAV